MSDPVATLGSTSDHGGTIITSASHTYSGGKLVARVGDLHSCPLKGHGITPIVSTPATTDFAEGSPIACVGAKAGCGATIISGVLDDLTT